MRRYQMVCLVLHEVWKHNTNVRAGLTPWTSTKQNKKKGTMIGLIFLATDSTYSGYSDHIWERLLTFYFISYSRT